MNNIAISPHIFMYALQNQNVERKTAKQIDIKTLQQKEVVEISKETTNISELNTTSQSEEIITSEIITSEIEENVVSNVEIDINNQFVSSI